MCVPICIYFPNLYIYIYMQCEMQTALSGICTRVAMLISCDIKRYTTGVSYIYIYIYIYTYI